MSSNKQLYARKRTSNTRRNKTNKRNKRPSLPRFPINKFLISQGPEALQAPHIPTRQQMRFSLKSMGILQADAAGRVNYRFSLRNLARAVNGSGTYTDATNLGNLFDMYSVVSWSLEYAPVAAINAFSLPPLLLAVDYDDPDTAPIATMAELNAYACRDILDVRYRVSATIGVPRLTAGTTTNALGITIPVVIENGKYDFSAPPNEGVAFLQGEGYPLNLIFGNYYLSMQVVCYYQR